MWEFFTTSPEAQISYTTVDPIHGLSSLSFHKNYSLSTRHGVARRVEENKDRLRSGALTAVINPKIFTEAGSNRVRYGATFLWSADQNPAISTSNVSLYLAGYDTLEAGTWGVWRYDTRLGVGDYVVQTGPSTPIIAHDQPFALNVEWRQDPVFLQGVQIIVKVKTAPDLDIENLYAGLDPENPYADFTEVVNTIDLAGEGALMGESYGEGYGWDTASGTSELLFFVDRIRAERLTPSQPDA